MVVADGIQISIAIVDSIQAYALVNCRHQTLETIFTFQVCALVVLGLYVGGYSIPLHSASISILGLRIGGFKFVHGNTFYGHLCNSGELKFRNSSPMKFVLLQPISGLMDSILSFIPIIVLMACRASNTDDAEVHPLQVNNLNYVEVRLERCSRLAHPDVEGTDVLNQQRKTFLFIGLAGEPEMHNIKDHAGEGCVYPGSAPWLQSSFYYGLDHCS
eukprot:Gb_37650 [translate_table: standard]